jgi:N-acetylglucosaminyldiphosphoundecaprenol N-acetyl-beta-D-mannosaminyltransferase
MNRINLLNVDIHNVSVTELLEKLKAGGVVFTPNVDHLIKLQKDPDFYKAYQLADYRVCDSQILIYASRFLGTPLKEKISGSDLFPIFYNYYKEDQDIRIFLLGAAEGVAKKAQQRINAQIGRDIIVEAYSPSFGFEKNEEECLKIVDAINQSGATVLAIGVGAPKQEMWISKYRSELKNIKIFLAIGATIDFEAGNVSRSPEWMSQVGLEWLYRLLCEPKRLWKRYLLDDLPFFWLILKQRLNLYKNPLSLKENCKASNS